MDNSYKARPLLEIMRRHGHKISFARACEILRDERARGVVRTAPYMPGAGDFQARRRINDAREAERREVEKETGKTATSSGKARNRNPYSVLASREHKQRRALLDLTTRKPDTSVPAPATVEAKSKTVSVGRVVIAGSIAEKIGGANR